MRLRGGTGQATVVEKRVIALSHLFTPISSRPASPQFFFPQMRLHTPPSTAPTLARRLVAPPRAPPGARRATVRVGAEAAPTA